jgi:hypothetical protein
MMIGLVLVLSACGGGGAGSTTGTAASGAASASSAAGAAASAAASFSADAAAGTGANEVQSEGGGERAANAAAPASEQQAQNPQAAQRLVIRTATQSMVVNNVDEAEARARQITAERGGYVLSSQSSGEDTTRSASITLKVPAERFDDTLAALSGLAQKVESQNVEGQDVTDEFVDLQARLRNLRAVEARLLQFLEEARNVEDSLRVSQELSNTQGQIEQTQGRITFLQQSAAFATITVSLRGVPTGTIASSVEWSPLRTAREALSGVITFGQALVTLAIVVLVWSPVWGPLLLLGMWLWRRGGVPTRTV